MNKKGLTLVELMAVIAILGVISIMIIPGVISIRQSVLQSTYENKISQIVSAARDYGMEHITELKSPVSNDYHDEKNATADCIFRTVNFLINGGYLKASNSYAISGQENTDFLDPRDGTPMNNKSVCIRFDNNNVLTREVIAYLVEENGG